MICTLLLTLTLTSTLGRGLEVIQEVKEGIKVVDSKIEHKLHYNLNPGCPYPDLCGANSTAVTLANLTILDEPAQKYQHAYIWSLIGHPSMQLALTLTPPSGQFGNVATFDWHGLLGGGDLDESIGYAETPEYTASFMIKNLIEYDDVNDNGILDANDTSVIYYDLLKFSWRRFVIENSTDRLAYGFIGENYTSTDNKYNITSGHINITLAAYASDGFGVWLPHLTHSEKTNQFDIQLDKIHTSSGFKNGRFALQMYLVSDAQKIGEDQDFQRHTTRTLDDEHTPGIFNTDEIILKGYNSSLQSYLQWRPVVYTTMARDLAASTNVKISRDVKVTNPSKELNGTIMFAFYGLSLDEIMVKTVNVSMGSAGDGFYKKTNYTAWTFTFGSGTPIHNGMSPAILLAMTVMIVVLILVSITALCICYCKRYKKDSAESQGLIDNTDNY